MNANIKKWARECLDCQKAKIRRHVRPPIKHFSVPVTDRFQCFHMDIVGLLPPSKPLNEPYTTELSYLVTFADRATRWLEAVPVSDIRAETIAAAFLSVWISHFGIPFVCRNRQRLAI